VVLLPGLVNAHCHLDYTEMAGEFTSPRSFTDWIKLITTTKAQWGYSEYAQSWIEGAWMLARTGTTTVGDIENVPELLPDVWEASPLRVVSFLEMTGIKSRRDPAAILADAAARIRTLPAGRCRAGLSPHAPYSTVPELLRLSAQCAREQRWPVTIHAAESAEEYAMFRHRKGVMFNWLRRNGRDMSDCGSGTPIEHLEQCGALGPNLVVAHANYLGARDAGLLAKRKASIAHCPRSHAFFGHKPFAYRRLSEAGINICLATDSLATVRKPRGQSVGLDMFEEMRAFAAAHTFLEPITILRMATINGARALGLTSQAGQLSPGSFADIITIPFSGGLETVHETALAHRGPVTASMVGGQWAAGSPATG
jgi:cytosine/adenosine deaminase-related metal-dependent hydrolase